MASGATVGPWPPAESGQRVAGFEPLVRAVEAGEISWHDIPTPQRMLMPIDLIIRCAAATTARAAGRHRGVRRSPGRTRARSTTNRK